tara:strand:+ start:14396 stop:14920 length:525 start_codon:yes stop_codon:yes gene_type:complete
MTTKEISKSIIFKYGFLLGLVSVSMSIVLYTQNKHLEQSQTIGLISILFILAAIILGIRTFSQHNDMGFGDGLKIGIGITVVGAVIITFYNYIFSHYIDPDFINQMSDVQQKAMEASGQLTTEEITARLEKLKEGADSFITSAIGIVFSAFLGFVFSAVTTVVFIKINESKNQA